MSMRFLISVAVGCLLASSVYGEPALRAGDMLDLKINGVPDDDVALISGSYAIDGEGYLHFAYISRVMAQGLTPSQILAKVERAYIDQRIFAHPTISLNTSDATHFVFVGGADNAKRRVPYTADMTVSSAIGATGDSWLNLRKVRLIRGKNAKTIDCRKLRADPSLDEKVLPGDNIEVPANIW